MDGDSSWAHIFRQPRFASTNGDQGHAAVVEAAQALASSPGRAQEILASARLRHALPPEAMLIEALAAHRQGERLQAARSVVQALGSSPELVTVLLQSDAFSPIMEHRHVVEWLGGLKA